MKKFLSSVLALLFSISIFPTSVFAAEPVEVAQVQVYEESTEEIINDVEEIPGNALVFTRDENGEIQYSSGDGKEARIPGWDNILVVKVYDQGDYRWEVSIQNIGLDWIDKVSMRLTLYKENDAILNEHIIEEEQIKQFLPRIKTGQTRGWRKLIITDIVGIDEGDEGTLDDIPLERTEE